MIKVSEQKIIIICAECLHERELTELEKNIIKSGLSRELQYIRDKPFTYSKERKQKTSELYRLVD